MGVRCQILLLMVDLWCPLVATILQFCLLPKGVFLLI